MYDICYYSSASQYGGAEIYIETLITGCVNAGKKCVIILNRSNSRLIDGLDRKKIPYFTVEMNEVSPIMYIQISRILRKINPALLHINLPGPWNCHLIATLGKLAGISSIVTTEHLPMFGPSIRHTPIKALDRLFIDQTITVSHENVQYLKNIHKIKSDEITVVHNGIDVRQYVIDGDASVIESLRKEYGVSDDEFVVGIVGRLTEQKGHKYAIQAMAALKNEKPNIKLLVFGDGELISECVGLTESLNLSSTVKFLGFQKDMYNIYSMLDVLLMPSIFEALPLTLIEAMATGLPVIASNVNGIPEVIDHEINGVLIEPKNVVLIQEAITNLDNDRNKLRDFGINARKKIEDSFSLEKMVEETVQVYMNVGFK